MNSYYEYRFPLITVGVFRLILLFTISYLTQFIASFFSNFSIENLILSSQNFSLISLLTYFFVVPINLGSFLSFLFDILILWGFGSELERSWGTKNFYKYFFIGIYSGVIFLLLIGFFFIDGLYAYGLQAGIIGILLAYGILWPNREVLFFMVLPLKMKWVVLVMFLFLAFSSLSHFIISLGGGLGCAFYLYFIVKRGKIYSYYENFQWSTVAGSSQDLQKKSLFESIKNKFIEFKKKKRVEKKKQEILKRIEMKEELDRILEKISKEGMNSLTKEEKKFLDKASKEL